MVTRHCVMGLLAAGVLLAAAPAAKAQVPTPATEKFYLNVNFGAQFADRTTTSNVEKTVYDETASLVATQPIGSGLVFDVGGGYRVWEDVYVGLVVTRFSNTHQANYTATIPDPFFFGSFKTVNGLTDELKRTEVSINPHLLWVTPLTDKIDISIGLGLSIIQLKQDVLADFTVPQPTQDVNPIVENQSGTAIGVYAAADFIYGLTPRYGVGGFLRYAGGKADLGAIDETDVGGLQAGAGIRLRF